MNRATLPVAFALLLSTQASGVAAQQRPSQGPAELRVTSLPRPFASAVPAIEAPKVDGLLDDRAWRSVFVQSLIQYNDRTDRWSTNLRFHVLETAGTGLFVVYNDTESLNGLGPVDRAFIVKYVRQFDVLK